MRETQILIEPFHFLNYICFECVMELNHHSILKIKGLIEEGKVDEYEKLAESELWVCVKVRNEENIEKVFFYGLLTGWELSRESGCNILSIEIHSGSYLLDIKPHIRSFQIEENFYSDVLEQCLAETGSKFIMQEQKDIRTGRFLLQYNETDWEFLLRISGYMEMPLIPETNNSRKKVYLGMKKQEKIEEITTDQYKMEMDANGKKIIVFSRDIYNLGENILFSNEKMIIEKIITNIKGSELFHEYHLSTSSKDYIKFMYNSKIKGVSLQAKVIDTKGTVVKIVIDKDENKAKSGSKWFDYATVYSTPDGAGWYCMPEVGDEVRILFPDEDERNAYVMSSIHLKTVDGRNNPEHKSWKNRQEKEILFTPDALILRNNKGLSLELSDQEGIKIISDKDIILQAGQDIQVVSENSEVEINAESSIKLEQKAAKIDMDEIINIYGGKIYMN